MSSLVFDEMETFLNHDMVQEPELFIVEPRHMLRSNALASLSAIEEVVSIGGRFTVSF